MRNRIKSDITLSNWEEANEALRQIGENDRDITAAETVMNEQIANAKAAAEAKCSKLREHSGMLVQALKHFATRNRTDMGARKSKKLTFGTLSFRQSTKISLPGGKAELEKMVSRLLDAGMDDCVVVKPPTVDRAALKKYSTETISDMGASIKTSETFGYEVDVAQIPRT